MAEVIADNIDEQAMGGTLGANTDVKIPVVSVAKSVSSSYAVQSG